MWNIKAPRSWLLSTFPDSSISNSFPPPPAPNSLHFESGETVGNRRHYVPSTLTCPCLSWLLCLESNTHSVYFQMAMHPSKTVSHLNPLGTLSSKLQCPRLFSSQFVYLFLMFTLITLHGDVFTYVHPTGLKFPRQRHSYLSSYLQYQLQFLTHTR